MATGTPTPTKPPPLPRDFRQEQSSRYGDFVDEHLEKVRKGIRVSDFFAKAMGLGAFVLVYLLALIVIDHWIVDLGFYGRLFGLAGLILGSLGYAVFFMLPELLRKINPAYAAQMVEKTEPGLRNSLINLVMLRPKRGAVRESIYRQVEQQAATRLSRVDIGEAVDQSPLIRWALVLLGAMILFAAYTIFSPKSPFQSINRIVSPSADIARPSRVRISDVQPHNAMIFAGETVEVSALVDQDEAQPVWLIYSTKDGQKVDVKRPMTLDPVSFRHVAKPTDDGILTQTIDYRIVAGDAEAGPFRITVSQAPTIFVDEVVLDYPQYTGMPSESLGNQADVRALEGTRVTVKARTNLDIASAHIVLNPESKNPTRLKMISEGQTAEGSFYLLAKEDRTPLYDSYQLQFVTSTGKTNADAVTHGIEVFPDLAPEVEILTPRAMKIAIPENSQQIIEIRALDPDYGLSQIWLQAASLRQKRSLFNLSLLKDPGLGQRTVRFIFRPREYDLQAGDKVIFRAVAQDNRTTAESGDPNPNQSMTERYMMIITPARDVRPNEADGLQADDGQDGQPEQPGDGIDLGEGEGEDEGDNGEEGAQGNNEGSGAGGEESEGNGGGDNDAEGEGGNEGEGEGGNEDQGEGGEQGGAEGDPNNAANDGGEAGEGGATEEGPDGDRDGQAGEEGAAGGGEASEQNGAGREDGEEQGAGNNGEGAAGQQPTEENQAGNQEAGEGTDPSTNAGQDPNQDGPEGSRADDSGDPTGAEEQRPLDAEGGDDGEAFERVIERMKEQYGEDADGTPKPCPNGECQNDGQDGASGSSGEASSDGTAGEPSDGENGADLEGNDSSPKGDAEGGESEGGSPGQAGEPNDRDPGEGESDSDANPAGGKSGDAEGGQDGDSENSEGENGRDSKDPNSNDPGEADGAAGEQDGEQNGDRGAGEGEGESEGDSDTGENGDAAQENKGGDQRGRNPQGSNGDGAENGEGGENQPEGGGDKPDQPGSQGGDENQGAGDPSEQDSQDQDGDRDGGQAGENGSQQGKPGEAEQGGKNDGKSGVDSSRSSDSTNTPNGDGDWYDDEALPEPGGDEANLEYARKATNLALDYLKHNDDEKLKEEFGWTDGQMKEFVRRWEQMQKQAPDASPANNTGELNEALRSLGLRRGQDALRKADSKDDSLKVRDAGTRSQPPAEYQELYRDYLRSLSTGGEK